MESMRNLVIKATGLEEIETRPGKKFNEEEHEYAEGVENETDSGQQISEIVMHGYTYKGTVVQRAKVRLGPR